MSKKTYNYVVFFSLSLLYIFTEVLTYNKIRIDTCLGYLLILPTISYFLSWWGHKRFWGHFVSSFVFIWLAFVPIFYVLYYLHTGQAVTFDNFILLFQATPIDSLEFITDFQLGPWLLGFGMLMLVIWSIYFVGIMYSSNLLYWRSPGMFSWFYFLLLFVFSVFVFDKLYVLTAPYFVGKNYREELARFHELKERWVGVDAVFDAKKEGHGETYIVIIGESLSKRHMGAYGYFRETTPLLSSQENLLIFQNAFSNQVYSMSSLSLTLTEANQYNSKKPHESPSIVDVLNRAGFETYWVTNQILYSVWSHIVTLIGQRSKQIFQHNFGSGKRASLYSNSFDEVLLPTIDKLLHTKNEAQGSAQTNLSQQPLPHKNRIIFVHLMGSHGAYVNRYPSSFSRFSGALSPAIFGEYAQKTPLRITDKVNAYDNSVLYSDFVVHQILDSLKKVPGPKGFFYFSDHGEEVFLERYHNSAVLTYDMVDVPFIAWFSEEYKRLYPEAYQTLSNRTNTVFSNDTLYDTVIDSLHIQTDRYDPKVALSSRSFQQDPSQILTIHGKRKVLEPKNKKWHQKRNSERLRQQNQHIRVFPSSVNSFGKRAEVLNSGYRHFMVDVQNPPDSSQCLFLGLSAQNNGGPCLSSGFWGKLVAPHNLVEQVLLYLHCVTATKCNQATLYFKLTDFAWANAQNCYCAPI